MMALQNADEARCMDVIWPRAQVNDALRLPDAVPRVGGVAWDEGEASRQVAQAQVDERWKGVNVVVD